MEDAAAGEDRILTIPNVISLVRLLCVPVFLWLLFPQENRLAAATLLAIASARARAGLPQGPGGFGPTLGAERGLR